MRIVALFCERVDVYPDFNADAFRCSIIGIEAPALPCLIRQQLLLMADFTGDEIGRTYGISLHLEQDRKPTGAQIDVSANIEGMPLHGFMRLPMHFPLSEFPDFMLRSGGLHDLVVSVDEQEVDRLTFWVDDQAMNVHGATADGAAG
jgi:hypothetical protein